MSAEVVPLRKKPRARWAKLNGAAPRRARLNDSVVRALGEGERVYDSEIGGLYAQGLKNGKATFRVMADLPTRVHKERLDGPQTLERTVGRHPDKSAKALRTEARRFIALIKSGVDPTEPERGPGGPSLQRAWEDYRDDWMVKKNRSEKTRRLYEHNYNRLKRWHDKPLAVIASNPEALAKEHARIAREHRRKNTDGNGAADGSIGFLAIIYNRARAKGGYKLPPWPDEAVVMFGPRSRAHRGLGTANLPAWWTEAQRLEPIKREFLLFLLLSGLRAEDGMTASWANVDLNKRTLYLPKPKGGPRRAFYLPLTDAMLACINRVRDSWCQDDRQPSPWLFPSLRSASGHLADARAQYLGDDGKTYQVKTGHDLRHTFANVAKEAGVPEPVVGVLLNHKPRTITGGYHDPNSTPEFYREQMERISQKVAETLGL